VNYAAVYFIDRDYGFVYDGSRDDIYETDDSGETWRVVATDDWTETLNSLGHKLIKGIPLSGAM